ncbi:MAG: hypothetical protein ABIQ64_03780 [Candidatus Saccharimonadales bacterium]
MGPFSKKPSEPPINQQQTTPVDPGHETLPSASTQPVVRKEKHSKAFSFVSVLFLLTLLGAGVMTYLWYNQSADVESLNNEISQLKSEQALLKKQGTPETTGGKDFITQTLLGGMAESYHQANVTEGYQNTPYLVKIKYLDKDETFARVHIEYVSTDQNLPKNTLTGKFDHYIFKAVTKKNGEKDWVMLAMNPVLEADRNDLKNVYGVPSDVMDLTKEMPA